MSGIVGSRFNMRGSGVVAKLGTDGQVMTSAGAGISAVYEDAAGGGIDNADMWRIHTTLTGLSYPGGWVTANWERADSRGQGTDMQIGTGVTESSGTFTFPQTGIWKIDAFFNIAATNFNTPYIQVQTQLSDDGTNFQAASRVGQGLTTYDTTTDIHGAHASSVLFDVDNTTNCKVQFYFRVAGVQASILGSTTEGHNGVVFYRLGDT